MIIDNVDDVVSIKIVYFGPSLSGKTTSIKFLLTNFRNAEDINDLQSLIKKTIYFDYGIIEFQEQKYLFKIYIYTIDEENLVTKPTALNEVDGLIFVIDHQKEFYEQNLISWQKLISIFKDSVESLPIIIAFNKQDKIDKFNSEKFLKEIEFHKYKNKDIRYTIAINGEKILECFEHLLKLILKHQHNNGMYFTIKNKNLKKS